MDAQIYKKEEPERLKEGYKERLSSLKYSAIAFTGFSGISKVAHNMFKEIPHGQADAFMAYGILGLIALWAGADAVCSAAHALKTRKKIRKLEGALENDRNRQTF